MVRTSIDEIVKEEFKNGNKMLRLHQSSKNEVKLEIKKEWLPYLHQEVDLLSPEKFNERHVVFLYVEELIQMLHELKDEGKIDKPLLQVIETLLLALDYLTHERFAYAPFTDEHIDEVKEILQDTFSENKKTIFSNDANRPSLNKAKIVEEKDKIYCLDEREETKRLYMAVVYQKTETIMEHFKQVGDLLGDIYLQPSNEKVSYEESLTGKTNHDLHVDLLFYLNNVKDTFSWLLNSTSWRSNQFMVFDEIDICIKLGVK